MQSFGSGQTNRDNIWRDQQWHRFTCDDADVPPHGVVEITGFELDSEGPGFILTAQEAEDEYEDRYPKMINGPVRVKSGETGRCTNLGLVVAQMKKPTRDGDLAFGDWFNASTRDKGFLKRTWAVAPGNCFRYMGGFQEQGGSNTGIGIFQYAAVPFGIIFGKLSDTLYNVDVSSSTTQWEDDRRTQTARVFKWDYDNSSELELLQETFTVVNRTNVQFDRDDRFGAVRARGEWHIVFVGC